MAFSHNSFGSPMFLFLGGDTKIGSGSWTASGSGEYLFVDADNPADYSQAVMRYSEYATSHGPTMAAIGDNIVMVQVDDSSHPDSSGKDILIWDYSTGRPEIVGALGHVRKYSVAKIVSGRFFSECKPDQKIKFEHESSDCLDGYINGGFISPKETNAVKVLVSGGSTSDCKFENLFDQSAECPKVYIGELSIGIDLNSKNFES